MELPTLGPANPTHPKIANEWGAQQMSGVQQFRRHFHLESASVKSPTQSQTASVGHRPPEISGNFG